MHIESRGMLWVVAVLLLTSGAALGEEPAQASVGSESRGPLGLFARKTLSDNWFGLGEQLADWGLKAELSATQVYQLNLDGGLATHRHAGRYAGSYDLRLKADLEKLAGLRGLRAYVKAEGSWSPGLDASSVGSLFGVNDDAKGDQSIAVTQFWFEQALWEKKVRIRFGKLDLKGTFECHGCPVSFDGNTYANDKTLQFLNGALVNNPTIPFPTKGLGIMVHAEPLDRWYVSAGIADAEASSRETGFNTAFRKTDYFFSVFETGVTPGLPSARRPLQGAYRVGFWYDPQPKERLNGNRSKRDDLGLYVSLDQALLRETAAQDDAQGLGVFARFGWADSEINAVKSFWSAGLQYQGLIAARDDDVLACGVAQGRLSRSGGMFTDRQETVLEVYYNAWLAPWLSISPSVQYVVNPGGAGTDHATVIGVRIQAAF